MRAVDAIMECLKAEGVEHVFGIPGGANLPTYDALYDAGIRHVQCRHEQGAGHAAEGYAKASGRVGVALATSGPGATNLVTPIADAMMDSVPTVFLTGQVRTDLIGTDGFQEADISGITMPIVKHSILIQDPRDIPKAIHEAFHLASTGRPGPVLVDLPQDLSRADIPYEPVDKLHLPGYQPTTEGNTKQIRLAAKAMANSRRPVIYGGGGVINANAAPEFRDLCLSDNLPVTCTLMGLGAFPADHEQWLGMLGMHGTRTANYAMDEADLIVAIGARFDDRITGKLSEFAPRAKFIHIDVDPAEISKNVPAHIPIVGDAKNILPKLTAEYRALVRRSGAARGLVAAPARLAGEAPAALRRHRGRGDQAAVHGRGDVRGHRAARRSSPPTSASTRCGPRSTTASRGRASGSTPAAWARWASACRRRWARRSACPDQDVVCLAGDGSLIMNVQEFATCVDEQIPVKVFLMNNGYLGMVRQWQELFWDKRYSSVKMGGSPDWVKLAEAFGAKGMLVTEKSELKDAFRSALAEEGPVLVDVRVTKEENCYPMIPAGQAARDMVG